MSSAVLQKKLEELEAELDHLFRAPPKYPPFEISFDDIFKRFGFLEHLHSMESKHSQPENADRMREIGEKINSLKTAFATRKASDSQSICSDCTQALLNEFQEEGDDAISRSIEKETDFAAIKNNSKEEISGRVGKYAGAFGCGVIVGAVFVVKLLLLFGSLYGGFCLYDQVAFLVPPT